MARCTVIVIHSDEDPILEAAKRHENREFWKAYFAKVDLFEELLALHRHLEEQAKYQGVFIHPDTPESEGWLGPK